MAFTQSTELWLPIPDYEGWYSVSDHGNIRNEAREKGRQPGKILALRRHPDGYLRMTLCKRCIQKQFLVHRLVVAAFIGPIPKGKEVNHKNGVKHDNRVENLEIVTPSENQLHAVRVLGVQRPFPPKKFGEAHHRTTLTDEQVLDIRARYAAGGIFQRTLAQEYSVSQTCIGNIVRRKHWPHI